MPLMTIDRNPPAKLLRQFAGLLVAFAVVVAWVLHHKFERDTAALIVGAVLALTGLVGLVRPAAMRPIWIGWMTLAFPIGFVIGHVLLGAVYFLVVTPIGLLMRAAGRDPMNRRFDPSASSYWIARTPRTDPRSYFRQF